MNPQPNSTIDNCLNSPALYSSNLVWTKIKSHTISCSLSLVLAPFLASKFLSLYCYSLFFSSPFFRLKGLFNLLPFYLPRSGEKMMQLSWSKVFYVLSPNSSF